MSGNRSSSSLLLLFCCCIQRLLTEFLSSIADAGADTPAVAAVAVNCFGIPNIKIMTNQSIDWDEVIDAADQRC